MRLLVATSNVMVKIVVAAAFLHASLLLCTLVLADRDGSEQEQYYLKNFRNRDRNGEFLFIRNRDTLRKDRVEGAVDILPHNPYGELEDHAIPKFLIFVPLVAAWIALLILVGHSTPQATSIISTLCRQISEFTRNLSDWTAAMHERNRQRVSGVTRTAEPSSKRRENNVQLVASDLSISPSLAEIANISSDSDDGVPYKCDGQSAFSSIGRAKTVVVSNRNHRTVLRDPSPLRNSYTKHASMHAPRRLRGSNHNEKDGDRKHKKCSEYDKKQELHSDNFRRHKTHAKNYHGYRPEVQNTGSSGDDNGRLISHDSPSNKHKTHDLTPLEKKLSAGRYATQQ